MISDEIRNYLKSQTGISDKELDSMAPGYVKLYSEMTDLMKWKIIAEVTESEFCSYGCKVGDKLVFSGHLVNSDESTCPLCMGALVPLIERIHIMWDRIIDGRDPNDLWLRTSRCVDPGLKHGGLGRVFFKVYAEKNE
jgi:uncharacterized repeat protein (TIGR04076 family)